MTKIVIGTNTHGDYRRQNIAVDSLKHLKDTFDCVDVVDMQLKGEPSKMYYDISSITCLDRHSGSTVTGSTKKLPYINDVINVLAEFDCDYFIYTNSDVIVNSNLIRHLIKDNPNSFACSRLDIHEPAGGFNDILDKNIKPCRYEIAGFDVFVFKKSWFIDNANLFQDYLIGQPHWDQAYATILKLFGGNECFGNNYPPFCFHIRHEMTWQLNMTPEREFNRVCSERPVDRLAIKIFNNYLEDVLVRRQPLGAFMHPVENERELERSFFSRYI